jgi:hypothetical protein
MPDSLARKLLSCNLITGKVNLAFQSTLHSQPLILLFGGFIHNLDF